MFNENEKDLIIKITKNKDYLKKEKLEELQDILGDYLIKNCFDDNYKPNKEGKEILNLIDIITFIIKDKFDCEIDFNNEEIKFLKEISLNCNLASLEYLIRLKKKISLDYDNLIQKYDNNIIDSIFNKISNELEKI